ncbi:MAG: hypothetical protein HRU38_22250 [Saccharospirillaceae bacterium]|nr:hypothetical protein [Pseudomonadales bacterium]NRB81351.1 hypothetical protein [Saccharospirillaceae bacterium]
MDEAEFLAKFEAEKDLYQAFGNYVKTEIIKNLVECGVDVEKLIKIPVIPRVKDIASLIGKAFHRGKAYTNPYYDITDKVGVRVVVLTLPEVDLVCETIKSHNGWQASLDRDFDQERNDNPHVFDYQSKHFVVKAKKGIFFESINIPENTSCEIQIRTLMQHAYSELSHTVQYKSKKILTKKTTRTLSRSVALIEAVDDYFKEASSNIGEELNPTEEAYNKMKSIYMKLIQSQSQFDDKTNMFLFSIFDNHTKEINESIFISYFTNNPHIPSRIKNRSKTEFFYQQPFILFIYYLVGNKIKLSELKDLWPLDEGMIKPVFTDFGISIDL